MQFTLFFNTLANIYVCALQQNKQSCLDNFRLGDLLNDLAISFNTWEVWLYAPNRSRSSPLLT